MKLIIAFIFIMLTFNLNGQDVSGRIAEIRKMYKEIIKEKDYYSKKGKDITWDYFIYNDEEDRSLKKGISYYHNDNQIKMAIISTSIISDYRSYKYESECYYENDSIFFIYISERISERKSFNPDQSNETVHIKEKRIYFDSSGNCILFLVKEAKGNSDSIDNILQENQNIKENCTKAKNIINEIISLL